MKEHAKKAIKHDFELLGKTVPTLAVIALFLVGGGSAALLTSFGTVSGTADVQQAVSISGAGDDNSVSTSYDQQFVAGQTFMESHTVTNNNDQRSVSFALSTTGDEAGIQSTVFRAEESSTSVTQGTEGWDGSEFNFTQTRTADGEDYFGWDSMSVEKRFSDGDYVMEITVPQGIENPPENFWMEVDQDGDGTDEWQVKYHADTSEIPGHWGFRTHDEGWEKTTTNLPSYLEVSENNQKTFTLRIDASQVGKSFDYNLWAVESDEGFPESWSGEAVIVGLSENPVQASIGEEVHPDPKSFTEDQQKVWGEGLKDLSDQLEASVMREGDSVVFKATAPSDYAKDDYMTFAFDTDSNGTADFQIQWNGDSVGTEGWDYKQMDVGSSSWSEVPSKFVTSKNGRTYTLEVPVSTLKAEDSSYKFGVDSNGQPSENGGQTFISSDSDNLWYNGDNYVSSDHYISMSADRGVVTLGAGESEDFVFVNKFAVNLQPDDYKLGTTLVPATS